MKEPGKVSDKDKKNIKLRCFCRKCGKEVLPSDFDKRTLRKYMMYGLCVKCQKENGVG